ncbi:MAG: MiaB/RimO family radical SAM methylthiotransferase [Candidatus Omnitrophota bacterium]
MPAVNSSTIKFHTLGCKVNQYETQSIRERFLEHGFREIRGRGKPADFSLVNTCTVTAGADQKSRAAIRRCANESPGGKIIVTGCLVKNDSAALAKIKGVSFIVDKGFFGEGISDFCGRTRAFIKIQDGCDNFCAYCKVPLARGRSRSRDFKTVIKEAKALAEKGFREIVLTGICLGDYGRGLGKGVNLVKLVDELEKIGELSRIRLSSIEAAFVTEELIARMARSPKLCPHLHIPIQSGDDAILKKMRRRYTRNFYLRLINKIKNKIPDLAVTTDCLVGFPGETEKQFLGTLDLVRRIALARTHIFPYSPREGTSAYARPAGVMPPPEQIRERVALLKSAARACAGKYIEGFLGRTMPVLFESASKAKRGYWEGYTANYIKVFYKSPDKMKNELKRVKLKSVCGDGVMAK